MARAEWTSMMDQGQRILMDVELPVDWRTREEDVWPHPHENLVACALGSGRERGVGIWRTHGELLRWYSRAYRFAWTATGRCLLVYVRGHRHEPPLPAMQVVARVSDSTWQIEAEISIPTDSSGCAIEEISVSPSGRWAVTQRFSGQGECGFDVLDVEGMERVGGVTNKKGYMLNSPVFDANEKRVVAGYGPWLGGWWAGPDQDVDEPSCGGSFDFGRICVHQVSSHQLRTHRLELTIPKGWMPEDPWGEEWNGPTNLEPFEEGVRMELPGGEMFEHAAPLPTIVRIPGLRAFQA